MSAPGYRCGQLLMQESRKKDLFDNAMMQRKKRKNIYGEKLNEYWIQRTNESVACRSAIDEK